jgi:archaellum component FlaG (FlaF/FlaG flagellin family)
MLGATLSLSAQAQALFSSTLNTKEEFDQWTVINANNDYNWDGSLAQTWRFSADNTSGYRTYYNYHSTNTGDDWLISPAITPTVDGYYVVKYKAEGGGYYKESIRLCYGSAPTVEELSKNVGADYPELAGKASGYFIVDGKAGVPFYVAYYAYSQPDLYRVYAQGIEVVYSQNPVDLAVTEVTAPVSAEGLGENVPVKVKVKNVGKVDVAAGTYSIVVSVDGEEAFTEPVNQAVPAGEEIEVALAGTVDLSISHKTYTVTATLKMDDDIFADNNAASASVKHIGPALEPYTMGFESSEDTSDIKLIDVNKKTNEDDSGHWSLNVGSYWSTISRTGYVALGYNYSSDYDADDWAILDGISMKAGYHVLKYWVSTLDDTHEEAYSIYWGNDTTVEAMTNLIVDVPAITQAEYKQKIHIFKLDKDQVVYIGFHAKSKKDQNWLCIDDVEINSISATDVELAVTGISSPGELLPTRADDALTFTVMNQGIVDAEGTITVTADGEEVYKETKNLVAQEDKEFSLTDIISKLAVGKHTIKVSVYNEKDTTTSNNSKELTFTKLGAADLSWDFEDAKVPELFSFIKDDYEELSSSAVEAYGENGVGIQELYEAHKYYGKYMLAFSSWITDETSSVDRWLILPHLHVDKADACFVANFGSLAEYTREKYNICVSTKTTEWYYFDDVVNVASENYVRKNRGFTFDSKYVDSDVWVAVNLKTKDGDALGIDNIELHGCSLAADAAVNDIKIVEGNNFIFDGDILTFGDTDNVKVSVFNVNGQLVLSATGSSFNLSNLAKGVYIIRATTDKGVTTSKFVK